MQPQTLDNLPAGDSATIAALHMDAELYHRFAALGFRVGNLVQLIRRARFAGPLHVRIGTTEIILRRADARRIGISRPE